MSKENFDDQSKQVVSLFLSRCFLKEIENMFSVFLLSYRRTMESLGELEKAVGTRAIGYRGFQRIFFSDRYFAAKPC